MTASLFQVAKWEQLSPHSRCSLPWRWKTQIPTTMKDGRTASLFQVAKWEQLSPLDN